MSFKYCSARKRNLLKTDGSKQMGRSFIWAQAAAAAAAARKPSGLSKWD